MRATVGAFCLALGLFAACTAGAQAPMSEDAFVEAVILELRAKEAQLEARKLGRLHLHVEGADGEEMQMFLDNAYRAYRTAPEDLESCR